nr:immunoglobulin heavy chain junction region [Macaca mulatta]
CARRMAGIYGLDSW